MHITLAGFPTATELEGMSLDTTLSAPITTLSPIVTLGRTVDEAPMNTLSPIFTSPILVKPKSFLVLAS